MHRLAVEAGNVGTWFWDRAAGTVRWNDRLEAMFGLAPGTFPGTFDAYAELLQTDRDFALARIEAGMASGRPWTFEHRVVLPDGTVRYLEGRGEPVQGADGTAIGAAGVTLDVTERRLAADRDARRRAGLEALFGAIARVIEADSRVGAAREACATAMAVFGCELAGVVELEGDRLRVVASVPDHDPSIPRDLDVDLRDRPRTKRDIQRGAWSLVRRDTASLDPLAAGLLDLVGARVALRIPLSVGGTAQFAVFCAWRHEPDDDPDEELVTRYAEQVGFALERVMRLQAQDESRSLAERLQLALVPAPEVSAASVGAVAVYRPGEARLRLGGDFFDAIDVDGTVVFCIGDVSGHGPEAAALAAQVRAAWRALAIAGHGPAACLRHLDEVVRRSTDVDSFITLLCGRVDVVTAALEVASAGHPPPFVVAHDSTAPLVLQPSAPLGTGAVAPEATRHRLPQPWGLLCVTDGLFEGRAAPGSEERFGYDRLVSRLAVERLARFDALRLRSLAAEAEERNGGPLADDVALLLLTGA